MTEYRIVTNGETYRVEWRTKIWWWWSEWKFIHSEGNPWLPVDEHGQAIVSSNVAAQARQDGVIPEWPPPAEEIKEPIPPPIEVIAQRESGPS